MLHGLSEQIAYCYRRAAECRELAVSASSESDRNFYTGREQAWVRLANSYELSERVTRVTNEFQRRSRSTGKPLAEGAPLICSSCAVAMKCELSTLDNSTPAEATTALDVALFTCPNCGRLRNQLLIKPRHPHA